MSSERFVEVTTEIRIVTVLDVQTGNAKMALERTDKVEHGGNTNDYKSSLGGQGRVNDERSVLGVIEGFVSQALPVQTEDLERTIGDEAQRVLSAAEETLIAAAQEEARRNAAERINTPAPAHICANRHIEMSELEQRARAGDGAAQEEISMQAVKGGLAYNENRKKKSKQGFSS